MKKNEHELFHLLYDCSHALNTPILVFNHSEKMIRHFPDRFNRPPEVFRERFYKCLRDSKSSPFKLHFYSNIYYQNFFFYPIRDREGNFTYVGIGPFLTESMGQQRVKKLLVLNEMDFSWEEEMVQYFSRLPVVSLKKLSSIERILTTILPDEKKSNAVDSNIPTNEVPDYEEFKSHYQKPEKTRHPLELSNQFLNLFRQGDIRALKEYRAFKANPALSLGNGDALRSEKNHLITLISELARMTIDEGVLKDEVYSLSDFYINFLETQTSTESLSSLEMNIVQSFLSRLQKRSQTSSISPLVDRAKRYIFQNLTEPITLREIAQELNVHPNYLSGVFAKEMKSSITQFINQQRIKEAKELLTMTHYSLMEISILLGYNSQSYFTRVFKKQEGISPKDFRNKLQKFE